MFDIRPVETDYVRQRAAEFRAQVARRLDGSLTEDEFKPLRLMNGVYLQLHAYMLRVAIPYGTISPDQMRTLALLAEKWDKGYGHWTTRQNIQFNWPKLVDIPDMLDALADVGMHAIQTSGNTIRNVTTDAFAGAAFDEAADPRPYAELLRSWSTDHAEFQFLPRKFKIAISGGKKDRAVIAAHDIGLRLTERNGKTGFEVWIGGGLGRTPLWVRSSATSCPRRTCCLTSRRSSRPTTWPGAATTSTRPASRSPCWSAAWTSCAPRSRKSSLPAAAISTAPTATRWRVQGPFPRAVLPQRARRWL